MTRTLLALGLIAAAAAAVAAGSSSAAGASCKPTPSSYGPFNTSGAVVPRRARIGSGHVLIGRVLQYPGCAPLRGAQVELWQQSRDGTYRPSGRGRVVTDRSGAFRFYGPVPPGEGGRPPHIHVKVTAAGYQEVVTTYFLRGGEKSGRMTIVLVSEL